MKRWPINKAYFWETAPFFRLLLPLIAGIILYPYAAVRFDIPIGVLVIAFIASGTCYAFVARAKQNESFYKYAGLVLLQLSVVFAAWSLCFYHDTRNKHDWFGNSIGRADGYVATITGTPAEKERTWKLEVDVTHAVTSGRPATASGKAFVYIQKYNAPALREGDVIAIPDNWKKITNNGNPFEFDYAGYTARNNIYYQQFLSGDEVIIFKYADAGDLGWIRQVHHWAVRQLEWYITDRSTLGLLKAILVGDKDLLDNSLADAYAGTGIVHIMAISGAHISVFFLLVAALLAWLKHRRYRWVKYMAALPLIWLYIVVAGAPTSAVRAATMFSLLGIGFALQKNPNGVNQLLATAFILLCVQPVWLYDVGFQLSFTAVLSIFLFYKWVYRWYNPVNKVARALWAAAAVSIAAEVLVAPLVVYYFHLFPLQFIIANVLAYLFMSVVLMGGMLLIAVSPFYTIPRLVAETLTVTTSWFNEVIYRLQHLNFDSFHRLTLTGFQIVLLYMVITTIAVFLIKKHKQALFTGLICCSLFLISSCVSAWQSLNQNVFIVYNTQGGNHIELVEGRKCTILRSPEKTDPKTRQYVLQPAHINLHVKDTLKANENINRIKMGNQVIFFVDRLIKDTTLQADYVVLNTAKGIEMKDIKKVFNPGKVIISTAIPKRKAELWVDEVTALGIEVHDVGRDGAFVWRY